MSIAPPVGALNKYLSRLLSSKEFRSLRHLGREIVERFPKPVEVAAKRAEEYARGLVTGGTLFEELGFYYIGPIDGHNMEHLVPVLRKYRKSVVSGKSVSVSVDLGGRRIIKKKTNKKKT